MSLPDVIKRSGRNLRMAKGRTILTAMAIAVGGFTLVLTMAAGNGIRDYTNKLVANNFDPAELIVGRDREVANNGAPNQTPQEYDETVGSVNIGGGGAASLQVKQVTKADIEDLQKRSYVEQIRVLYQINTRYITREGQKRYTVFAEVYNPAVKPELKAGAIPGTDIESGRLLLPEAYLSVLGFSSAEDAIGKTVSLNTQRAFATNLYDDALSRLKDGQPIDQILNDTSKQKPEEKSAAYVIAGVTKKPATSLSVGQLPVLLGSADARALYDFANQGTPNYEKYLFVYARVKDGQDSAKLQAAQNDLQSSGYYVQSSKDIQKTITQFVNILQGLFAVFGIITLFASVFGIVNTQYISVLERTREIGLMRALGMRSRDVRRLFMIEATWIGFLGGLIGSLVAVIIGTAIDPWVTKQLELGDGNSLIIFKPLQIVLLIVGLMVVATVAGLFPARKAAKMDPIEALRSE